MLLWKSWFRWDRCLMKGRPVPLPMKSCPGQAELCKKPFHLHRTLMMSLGGAFQVPVVLQQWEKLCICLVEGAVGEAESGKKSHVAVWIEAILHHVHGVDCIPNLDEPGLVKLLVPTFPARKLLVRMWFVCVWRIYYGLARWSLDVIYLNISGFKVLVFWN